jgi:two-component system osmolarity sensor histidine kinase EnvZ
MRTPDLRSLLPRGIYGRAALILIVPIFAIQLVVSMAFIQRHFEDVTIQMTRGVVREIAMLLDRIEAAPDRSAALQAGREYGRPLNLAVVTAEVPSNDARLFYDLSGRVVIRHLREALPAVTDVDLSNIRRVRVSVATGYGPMQVSFERGRVSASNPHQLLVLMAVTGVLFTLIAFLFLRNQLRPIRRLARAAEAFGRGRNIPYAPGGAAEVRAAGNAFLDMRARIERHIEQRTLMLSGVSHDLRTPLTRLKLGLSMIDAGSEGEAMKRDIDEMQHMLDEFLQFAQGDAADGSGEVADVAAIVDSVIADARRTGQNVTLAASAGHGEAQVRPGAIRRAVENLVSNAVRYGTRVQVSVAALDRSIRITVEDDGPGIPKNQRDEALRPFSRLDRSRNQDRGGGVGLGLAIAADIARSHGGSLRLSESEDLGGLRADLVIAR